MTGPRKPSSQGDDPTDGRSGVAEAVRVEFNVHPVLEIQQTAGLALEAVQFRSGIA